MSSGSPTMAWRRARRLCLMLAALAGCREQQMANVLDLSATVPHNFQQINDEVLAPSCVFSSCHSLAGKSSSKLNLCSAPDSIAGSVTTCQPSAKLMDAYAALVGATPSNARAKQEGLKIVAPCQPEQSYMLVKLNLPTSATDPDVGYGEHMPKGNPSLPPEVIQAISDWIARGARFDEPADVTGTSCTPSPPDLAGTD